MGTRVYVGGLPRDASNREVNEGFNRYGKIANVWVARNPPGFAFVDFEDPRDADDAIKAMDGRDFLGGRIRVELARGGDRRRERRDDDRGDRRDRGGDRYDRNDRKDRNDRNDRNDRRGGGRERRNPPSRTDFRVRVSKLPRDADWRNVKDFLRTGGEVTYCNVESDGTAVADFRSQDDMENAIKKLDDAEFRGVYIQIKQESAKSNSPRGRGGDRDRRSRSPSPAAKESPRRSRSRSRSPSPAGSPRRRSRSRSHSPSVSPRKDEE